jgi:hypothetical protein
VWTRVPRRARCVRVAEADATAARLDEFVARCEGQLAGLLRDGATPDAALAHAIATAKVRKKTSGRGARRLFLPSGGGHDNARRCTILSSSSW